MIQYLQALSPIFYNMVLTLTESAWNFLILMNAGYIGDSIIVL